jgi:hypothetical protein
MPCRAVTSRAVPGHAARRSAWRCVLHNCLKFTLANSANSEVAAPKTPCWARSYFLQISILLLYQLRHTCLLYRSIRDTAFTILYFLVFWYSGEFGSGGAKNTMLGSILLPSDFYPSTLPTAPHLPSVQIYSWHSLYYTILSGTYVNDFGEKSDKANYASVYVTLQCQIQIYYFLFFLQFLSSYKNNSLYNVLVH